MDLKTLIESPDQGQRFIGQLFAPVMLLRIMEGRPHKGPETLELVCYPLLGTLLYTFAQQGRTARDLVNVLQAGPTAVLEWLNTVPNELADDAATVMQAHPNAANTLRLWAEIIDEALADPYTMELAEARTALGPLPKDGCE